eukprot:scaffold50096_cov63-Phaeocystis_antarctica.AAC.3
MLQLVLLGARGARKKVKLGAHGGHRASIMRSKYLVSPTTTITHFSKVQLTKVFDSAPAHAPSVTPSQVHP